MPRSVTGVPRYLALVGAVPALSYASAGRQPSLTHDPRDLEFIGRHTVRGQLVANSPTAVRLLVGVEGGALPSSKTRRPDLPPEARPCPRVSPDAARVPWPDPRMSAPNPSDILHWVRIFGTISSDAALTAYHRSNTKLSNSVQGTLREREAGVSLGAELPPTTRSE